MPIPANCVAAHPMISTHRERRTSLDWAYRQKNGGKRPSIPPTAPTFLAAAAVSREISREIGEISRGILPGEFPGNLAAHPGHYPGNFPASHPSSREISREIHLAIFPGEFPQFPGKFPGRRLPQPKKLAPGWGVNGRFPPFCILRAFSWVERDAPVGGFIETTQTTLYSMAVYMANIPIVRKSFFDQMSSVRFSLKSKDLHIPWSTT